MTNILWTSKDAAKATGGINTCDWKALGVSIDTRTIKKGDIFVALIDSRDGHKFVGEVLIETSKDTNSFDTQDYDKRNNFNYVISWIGKNFKKKSEAQIHSTKFTNHKFSKISIPNPVILENGRSSTIKLEKHTKKVTLAMKSDKLISSDKLNFKQLSEPQSSRNTPLQKYFTLDKPSLGQITLEDKNG